MAIDQLGIIGAPPLLGLVHDLTGGYTRGEARDLAGKFSKLEVEKYDYQTGRFLPSSGEYKDFARVVDRRHSSALWSSLMSAFQGEADIDREAKLAASVENDPDRTSFRVA